jgi:hypothetical protein
MSDLSHSKGRDVVYFIHLLVLRESVFSLRYVIFPCICRACKKLGDLDLSRDKICLYAPLIPSSFLQTDP